MTKPILVTIEHTPKKTFATAADWPGWSRSAKTEQLALEALAAYAPRYAPIADAEHRRFAASATIGDLEVVERHQGSAGTEFGVPATRPTMTPARPTPTRRPVWPVSSMQRGRSSTGRQRLRRKSSGRVPAVAGGTPQR